MRKYVQWAIALLVIAALGAGAARIVGQRKAAQAAAQQAAQKVEAPIELAATDVVVLRTRELAQKLPISGTLRAATSVLVKARVAGELSGLSVREGDSVRVGQVLARIDPTDLQARQRQAQQQAESAKAQVDIAQRAYDNNRSLVEQGFISKSSLDTSLSSLAAAQANHKAALAAVDMVNKSLDDSVLRAPIAGQVSQRLAQNGERMAVDGRVLEIVDLSRLEMEANLSPADSLKVTQGQTAILQVEGSATPLKARVARVNPSVVAGSRSVLAYLVLDPMPGLRQGLFVQGSVQVGTASLPAAPLSSVRTDRPQPYVQLVRDNKVVHQMVTLGERGDVDGEVMVGLQGLPENAVLISGSVGVLREGTLVRVASATK